MRKDPRTVRGRLAPIMGQPEPEPTTQGPLLVLHIRFDRVDVDSVKELVETARGCGEIELAELRDVPSVIRLEDL